MNAHLELLRELDLIEEDPWIMVFVIEPILKLLDALHRSVDLFVSTKHQKDRICLSELWVEGSRIHHLDGFVFSSVLAAEKIRYRGLLAVGFVGEAED